MQVSTMTPRGDTTVENDINDEPQSARSAPPPRLTYSEKLMRTRERRNTIVEMEQEKAIHRGNEKANYKSHYITNGTNGILQSRQMETM